MDATATNPTARPPGSAGLGADDPGAAARTPALGRRHHSHGLMHVLMLVATACWAANIVAGKVALESLGPMALAQFRVTGAAVVFLATFIGWRRRPRLRFSRREWGWLVLTALFGITLNQICFIGGISRTSAAHAGLMVATGPVMVLILSCAMRMESLTALKIVGTAVSFIGVAVLTTGKASQTGGAHWQGDLLLLAGSAVFAYYTILAKQGADRYDTVTFNLLIFVLGAAMMIPVSAHPVAAVRWGALPPPAWEAMAFMVVCGSVAAYLIYAFALTELTATRVAAFAYLQPAIAAGLGFWVLAERITVPVVAGGALILGGVYLTERERGEQPAIEAPASADAQRQGSVSF